MSGKVERLQVASPARYKAAAMMFAPLLKSRGVDVEGIGNLPLGNAPYLLTANHRSLLDIPVLGRAMLDHDGSQMHFVTKKELMKIALIGGYIRKTGVIEFDRDEKLGNQPDAARTIEEIFHRNGIVAIFPEGTRKNKGPQLQTQRGLGMLAVENRVPIATAGIYGTDIPGERIRLNFGRTIYPGVIGDDNRRRRMVDMEREYTAELQQAVYAAYDMAGAGYGHAGEEPDKDIQAQSTGS